MVTTAKLYRPGGLTGGNGLMHCQLVPSNAPFTGGTITLYNNQATPLVVDVCYVVPSAAPNDGYCPVDGSWAAVAWTVLAGGPWVSHPAPPLRPGCPASGRGLDACIPIAVRSIARSDIGGVPVLLMFHVHLGSWTWRRRRPTSSTRRAPTVERLL